MLPVLRGAGISPESGEREEERKRIERKERVLSLLLYLDFSKSLESILRLKIMQISS